MRGAGASQARAGAAGHRGSEDRGDPYRGQGKMGPHILPSDDGGGSPSVHSAPVHGPPSLQAHGSGGDPPDPADLTQMKMDRQVLHHEQIRDAEILPVDLDKGLI